MKTILAVILLSVPLAACLEGTTFTGGISCAEPGPGQVPVLIEIKDKNGNRFTVCKLMTAA